MVTIKKQLVKSANKAKFTIGGRKVTLAMKPKFLVLHETGNKSKGAGAQAHANLQSNGNSRLASWHYQVDSKEVIQSIPITECAIHAGDGINGKGNRSGIAIEICVNEDSDFKKAVANAVELVAQLMKETGISITNVKQHNYFSGKNCPQNLRMNSKGVNWENFISDVKKATAKPVTKPVVKPVAKKTFKLPNTTSVVDFMKANNIDSSFANRKKLALKYGIKSYTGTASQNAELLKQLKK